MASETSQIAPANDDALESIQRRNGKLTYSDIALLLQLRDKGASQTELAAYFKVTQGQISRLLASFADTKSLAKLRLNAESDRVARATLRAIDKAADAGDASAGLELLDRLDIAVKKRQEGNGGAKVMIVVGGQGGGIPDGLPVIDVSA